jgi:hemerythrin-like domain-containing protein
MIGSLSAASAEHAFAEHEHRELRAGMDRIHELACTVARSAEPSVAPAVTEALEWLVTVLAPHAAWEDGWLYPHMDSRAGTHWATRVMAFEHQQIRRLIRELIGDQERGGRGHDQDHVVETAGRLFAIEGLLRAHIEREEELLIPLLDDEPAKLPTAR